MQPNNKQRIIYFITIKRDHKKECTGELQRAADMRL